MNAWDLSDPANPKPNIWPKCPTCDTPWAYKWALSLSHGATWVWVRDCKHKGDPVLTTADGPYEPAPVITMRFHCEPCGASEVAQVPADDPGAAAEVRAEWNTDHGGCALAEADDV